MRDCTRHAAPGKPPPGPRISPIPAVESFRYRRRLPALPLFVVEPEEMPRPVDAHQRDLIAERPIFPCEALHVRKRAILVRRAMHREYGRATAPHSGDRRQIGRVAPGEGRLTEISIRP